MSLIKGIMTAVENPYASIAKDGLICGDVSGYIDTGIHVLNALVSGDIRGGFPKGKVVALAGKKGTGKTFILLKALKEYLDTHPKGEVVFFESEGAITKKMLEERGLDLTRVLILPVSTVEELRHQVLVTLDKIEETWGKKKGFPDVVFCLDSLGMLGTDFEVDTSRSNKNKADMGKRAQLIKSTFRIITLRLSLWQIPMIITNHTYKGMGQYDPTQMSGGQGLEYAASIIIFIGKMADKEDETKGKSKIKTLVGNNINFIVHKGRMTIEGSKATVSLSFKGGISRYAGLVDWFVKAGVFEKSGAWYSWGDERIGQGEKNVYLNLPKFIKADPKLLDSLNPYVEEKFCYGVYKDEDTV